MTPRPVDLDAQFAFEPLCDSGRVNSGMSAKVNAEGLRCARFLILQASIANVLAPQTKQPHTRVLYVFRRQAGARYVYVQMLSLALRLIERDLLDDEVIRLTAQDPSDSGQFCRCVGQRRFYG